MALSGLWEAGAARMTQNPVVSGRVTDENGAPVEYATVVILSAADRQQVTGATSGSDGGFKLTVPKGSYVMEVYYLGYENYERPLELASDTSLEDIGLLPSVSQMEAVTVTARLITREADRFVVNVANNPVAIGKDAYEMLKTSPGVWISKDQGITINGKSGTRVIVNDRLLRMDDEQLEAYLRSINAEDLVKIEVIPDAGAEYDADSRGGIVKITLAKQRNDGIQGSAGIAAGYGYYGDWDLSPTFNINYQTGKLNLYANAGATFGYNYTRAWEETQYRGPSDIAGSVVKSDAVMDGEGTNYNARIGALYDINPKQNVGAEFGFFRNGGLAVTDATASLTYNPLLGFPIDSLVTASYYESDRSSTILSGTVNYVLKLDEKGSTFKLIGDYNQSMAASPNTYRDASRPYLAGSVVPPVKDSLYSSDSDTDYKIASLNANFDYVINPTTVLKFGGKYTYNNMYSKMVYGLFDFDNDKWDDLADRATGTDYVEHVGALYAIGNARFGKLGLALGLRGEFTAIRPRYTGAAEDGSGIGEAGKDKNYFDLFPNANISYALNDTFSNMFVLSYSRKISRPGFWALTPFRSMLSAYSSIVGNPDLRPTYANDISLTGVFGYKYTLTVGVQMMTDQVMQKVIPDEGSGESSALSYKFMNIPRSAQYYVAINAPINITDWWTVNANLVGGDLRQRLEEDGDVNHRLFAFTRVSTNFSLPKGFDIELTHWYQSKVINANLDAFPSQNLNAAVKKRFAKNRFTASLGVDNIITRSMRVDSYGPEFYKQANIINNNNSGYMTVRFSLRYNFQSGTSFKAKQVEKGSAEDAKRLGGGQ